jgi:hypothetical protein
MVHLLVQRGRPCCDAGRDVATLLDYFQPERPITPGNTLDRIHAQYLIAYERVVTADADFYKALVSITQQLTVPGSPVFVKRPMGGSALAELKTTI